MSFVSLVVLFGLKSWVCDTDVVFLHLRSLYLQSPQAKIKVDAKGSSNEQQHSENDGNDPKLVWFLTDCEL